MNTIIKHFLFTFLLIAVSVASLPAKTYVVSVGLSRYLNPKHNLRMSDNDARVINDLFATNKCEGRIMLCNENATRDNVCSAMKRAFAAAGPDDTIILFFSGHGVQGAFMCYDRILKYKTIQEIMLNSKAKNKIILADACFSGKISEYKILTRNRNTNIMYFLSSRAREVSKENPNGTNSVFTAALLQALKGGADANRDRTITARELFDYVHTKIVSQTTTATYKQHFASCAHCHQAQKLSSTAYVQHMHQCSHCTKMQYIMPTHPVMYGNFDSNMPVIKW